MKSSEELKRDARESLRGNMGKAGGTYLVYMIATVGISFVLSWIPIVGTIAASLIAAGILYGCVAVLMKIKRNQEVSVLGCLEEGIKMFWKVFCCNLWVLLNVLLWSILFVISMSLFIYGISENALLAIGGLVLMIFSVFKLVIKSLSFSLVNFLIYDNKDLRAKDIVNKSEEIMKENGNVKSLFMLNLSFFGWLIVYYIGASVASLLMEVQGVLGFISYIAVIAFGLFFLSPYMQMANICFYEELVGPKETIENEDPIMNI